MSNEHANRLQRDYLSIVSREICTDGTFAWAARNPDLPGCLAQGETPEEALSNLAEARELYLEDLVERGMVLPQPNSSPLSKMILQALEQPVQVHS